MSIALAVPAMRPSRLVRELGRNRATLPAFFAAFWRWTVRRRPGKLGRLARSQRSDAPRAALRASLVRDGRAGRAARRLALSRLEARSAAARRRPEGVARCDQGPADEGGAALGDAARRAAARICRRARDAAVERAADGLAVRQAAHGERARRGLAGEVQELLARGGVRRVAGPGPPRARTRRPRIRLQAAISRHGISGRGRPPAAEDRDGDLRAL